MRVFFIENDGFTYNLIEEFEKRDCEVITYGNNADIKIIDNAIKKFNPDLIVISGYGNVNDSRNFVDIIMNYNGKIPIFGVGLGYLCIIEAFEGKVGRSPIVLHGKTAKINHDGKTIFKKIESPFDAAMYNSLTGVYIPYTFEVSARSENDIVMGIRHKEFFVEGINFHPESILSSSGSLIMGNLIREIKK